MLLTIIIAALCIDIEHLGLIYLSNPDSIIHNYGMAFSLLTDYPAVSAWLSVIATLLLVAVFFLGELNTGERIGFSIMLGGALSNCAEKIILGYVIDWIPVPFVNLTVNIADIEVSLGAVIAMLNFEA